MNSPIKPFKLCLWFNTEAEEAANFYCSIFQDGSIQSISRYGKEGFEFHKKPEGTAMTVEFTMNGTSFLALNGGNNFTFNEAVSLMIFCQNQEEIDYYWNKLTEGGEPGRCGWLKDKFGFSWQVIPANLNQYLSVPDAAARSRVLNTMYSMNCFQIALLEEALKGI